MIPELGSDSKAKLVVLPVMLQVIDLHLLHVLGHSSVMESIMHAVVENVERVRTSNDTFGEWRREDGVGEFEEGAGEGSKEDRWHDESESVHGKVVVNAVEEEVEEEGELVVWEVVVDMEEEAMHEIFDECPK